MSSAHPWAEQGGGRPAESGALAVTLSYPATAFLYRATSPRVRVDGSDVEVAEWGSHRVPVAPGRHRVEVWVPYAIPRRAGRARTEVSVAAGEEVSLEYMAPTVTFLPGSLGVPGGQRSAGWSAVMVFQVVGVAAAALALLIVAFS